MNTKKLKTLKDLKIKNPYQIERFSLLFEEGVYHTKKAVRTELGLKRIVDIDDERNRLEKYFYGQTKYNKEQYEKFIAFVKMDSNIKLLMEIFNITKEDIKKFKEENK